MATAHPPAHSRTTPTNMNPPQEKHHGPDSPTVARKLEPLQKPSRIPRLKSPTPQGTL